MKKIIFAFGLIALMVAMTACTQETLREPEITPAPAEVVTQPEPTPIVEEAPPEKVAPDQVDIIPGISFQECMVKIRQDNPEMTQQAALDNCYTIEAANKNDINLCNKVSEGFRPKCLAMFK